MLVARPVLPYNRAMRLPQPPSNAGDSFDFGRQRMGQQTASQATGKVTSRGRRLGGVDNGTVALALGAASFYWLMPLMASRRRARRPAPKPPGAG